MQTQAGTYPAQIFETKALTVYVHHHLNQRTESLLAPRELLNTVQFAQIYGAGYG